MYELFPFRRELHLRPASSFEEARQRFALIAATEQTDTAECAINDRCYTFLLDHGVPTEHALLLIHGFTNCPYQFHQLAPLLHERGYTVLAIRLPRHGCADRMTDALAKLRIAEILDVVTEAVDIVQGLGRRVTVLGFSMGGVIAAWLAQNRADLYRAILVSPAVGLQALPIHRHRLIGHGLALLPNFYQWWNPQLKAERVGPDHAYPRFASHSLAVLIRLGLAVRTQAMKDEPATRAITVVMNPADTVVDPQLVAQLVANWVAHGAAVIEHAFPDTWGLLHDLIDPLQEGQQVARVYPLLLQWIEESLAPQAVEA